MKLKLFTFTYDPWYGQIDSMFLATDEEIEKLNTKEIILGEVLGKHSEVYFFLKEGELRELNVSEETIENLYSVCPNRTLCGYSLLDFLNDD
jgi:uncharacterized protein YrrD